MLRRGTMTFAVVSILVVAALLLLDMILAR